MGAKTLMTVEQFFELPCDELRHSELVQGEIFDLGNTSFDHDEIRDTLLRRLANFVESHGRGLVRWEAGVQIDSNSYYVADGAYWDSAGVARIDRTIARNMVPPSLVLEVASPTNSFTRLLRKARDYQRAGTQVVWIVNDDPFEIHVFDGSARYVVRPGEKLECPSLLPGFSIDAASLDPSTAQN